MREIRQKYWTGFIIALGAVLIIITRIIWESARTGFDNTSLILFTVASVALLIPYAIPYVKKLKYKDTEIEFKELEQELPKIQPGGKVAVSADEKLELRTGEDWNKYREEIKQRSREVFLAHVIKPSNIPRQKFDIYIFLIRTKSLNLEDVEYAEFFFGRHWGNQVFLVRNDGGKIGISTSAYGPFLCTCRITFKDGYQAKIERLIDFEMARVFEITAD